MDDGFTLACQVAGSAPGVVGVEARVRVVRALAPLDQGFPLAELTHAGPPSERWW